MGNSCCQQETRPTGQNRLTQYDGSYFQEDSEQTLNPIFKNSSVINSTPPNQYQDKIKCGKPAVSTKIKSIIQNPSRSKIYQSKIAQGLFEDQHYLFKRSGNIYYGHWLNGLPHGSGTMYFQKGNVYQGKFIEGVPFQYGKLIMTSGAYYEGQINYGKANGEGVYIDQNYMYKGFFKNDLKHGAGQEKQEGVFYFIGDFENGEKIRGKYKYGNRIYSGTFQNDQFSGKGELIDQDGNSYKGSFSGGKFHGYGQFKWKDGTLYRGNYIRGLPEGDGQLFNAKNSSISKGIWKRGVLNGEGEYRDYRGNITKCIWNDGKMISIKTI